MKNVKEEKILHWTRIKIKNNSDSKNKEVKITYIF